MFMCVKVNSLYDREMKVFYVPHVLKEVIKIKTMCSNYILKFRKVKSHLLQVCLGVWGKIKTVIEKLLNCWSLLI